MKMSLNTSGMVKNLSLVYFFAVWIRNISQTQSAIIVIVNTVIILILQQPLFYFWLHLHMQINVLGEIPFGGFSKASPIILPIPTE